MGTNTPFSTTPMSGTYDAFDKAAMLSRGISNLEVRRSDENLNQNKLDS